MNYNKLFPFLFIIFLSSCSNSNFNNNIDIKAFKDRSSNKGFTLVYSDKLLKDKIISKKIDNRSLTLFHRSLKKNSNVKITNLKNKKSIIAKVKSNRVEFPNFFNSVISKRISEDLDIDPNEPYIEILLILDNSSFIVKKSKTFEEEKNVAEKAPIDGIQINDLNESKIKESKKVNSSFSFSIKVADFYYEDSAQNMINRIKKETNIKKLNVSKLSKTKFRVVLGPFNDIISLKNSFNEIIKLGFENIEIIDNV